MRIDLSAPMLDIARQRRERKGVTNVEFVQGDAQTHRFGSNFDVAISRFGTMFFTDPVAAFVNIGTALRPHGRLCLATWQPLAANDWLTIPGAALLRYGTRPEGATNGPGMFGQSDAEIVTATLHESGYRNVDLTPLTVTHAVGRHGRRGDGLPRKLRRRPRRPRHHPDRATRDRDRRGSSGARRPCRL